MTTLHHTRVLLTWLAARFAAAAIVVAAAYGAVLLFVVRHAVDRTLEQRFAAR